MNKRAKKLNVIIVTVLTIVSVLATSLNAEASGTTYYVAMDGNDSNPGTIGHRFFGTIQEAMNTLRTGATSSQTPLFVGDFETGDLTGFYTTDNGNTPEIVSTGHFVERCGGGR